MVINQYGQTGLTLQFVASSTMCFKEGYFVYKSEKKM